jgi:hypothetical protein
MAPWCVVASRLSSSPAFASSSPSADRQYQLRLFRYLPDPIRQRRVVHLLAGALAAGNEQQVGAGAVNQAVVRVEAQAITGPTLAFGVKWLERYSI